MAANSIVKGPGHGGHTCRNVTVHGRSLTQARQGLLPLAPCTEIGRAQAKGSRLIFALTPGVMPVSVNK